ncbi:MAG: oligosaccharide flippase family protein [Chlorobiota bacterium]
MKAKLKELAGQTATYGIFNIIGRFLTFILFPLYINYLPKTEYADIVIIYVYIGLLNILYATALESSFFRFYKKDDFQYSKQVFSHSFIGILIFGSIISISIFILSDQLEFILSGEIENSADLIRIAAFVPLIDAIQFIPYGLLRMTNKAKSFIIIRFVHVIFYVSLTFIAVAVLNLGVFAVLVIQLLASLVTLAIHIPRIMKYLEFSFDSELLKKMLVYGVPTLPAAISSILLNVADKPIVKAFSGSEAQAVYSANYKLGIPMLLYITAFDYAWRPFFLNNYNEEGANKLFSKILTYFTFIGSLIFLSFSYFVRYISDIPFIGRGKLLPNDYKEGLVIIPIILLAYWFNGMYNNFSASLHIAKKTKYLAYSIVTGTAFYFAAMYILIPEIGYIGAAWATLIGFFVNAVLIYYFSNKTYKIEYEWKKIITIAILTLIGYFANDFINLEYGTMNDFISKVALLFTFLVLLKLFGFFTKEEMRALKRLIKRK